MQALNRSVLVCRETRRTLQNQNFLLCTGRLTRPFRNTLILSRAAASGPASALTADRKPRTSRVSGVPLSDALSAGIQ